MKKRLLLMTLAVVVGMLLFSGCTAKNPLVGKWEFYDANGNISNYEFVSNNKVIQDTCLSGWWSRTESTYKLKNGNIIITNGKYIADGETTDAVQQEPIPYSVDGDVLVLHEKYEYTRVNEFTNEYQSDYRK